MWVDEEQSLDSETSHVAESLDSFAFTFGEWRISILDGFVVVGVILLVIFGASLTSLVAHEDDGHEAGQTVIKRQPITQDFYAAAEMVLISGPASGDVVIAGRRLSLDGPVAEDVIAAGEIITINGNVGDDIRAAGQFQRPAHVRVAQVEAVGVGIDLHRRARLGRRLHRTTDRHRTVDDRPYGGGPGMVMKIEPLRQAIDIRDGSLDDKIEILLEL